MWSCSKTVRKGIATVLTVLSQKQKEALREAFSKKVTPASLYPLFALPCHLVVSVASLPLKGQAVSP